MSIIDSYRRDLSYAVRSLRQAPAFGATAVLILGLAIGMTSAMCTVLQSVLLQRLPVVQQDRIVELSGVAAGAATEFPLSPEQFQRFRSQTKTLTNVTAFAHWRVITGSLTDGDRSLALRQALVADNFFEVLGARPVIGRVFRHGEADPWGTPQSTNVDIVLSYEVWRRAFNSDSSVLGHHLTEPKRGWTMTIIGVAPPGLDYPRGVEYWTASNYGSLDLVGRLAAGSTPEAARSDFLAFLDHDPDLIATLGKHAIGAQVNTLDQMVTGEVKPALLALSAAVALLLLLACTNVGNLMLLRAAGRVREMAIRRALGASSADLVRQLLTESVLLALAGGMLGLGLARAMLEGLIRLAPSGVPRSDVIQLAGTPLVAGAAVTMVTVILFGIVPSLATLRFDLASPLHSDARSGTEGRRLRKIRQALVASQVALAVVVLSGAGLVVRSLERLTTLSMGYATDHISLLSVSFPWRQMSDDCRPRGAALTAGDTLRWRRCNDEANFNAHDRVLAQLHSIPGVVSASPATAPPFLGSNVWMGKIVADRQSESEGKENPWFGLDLVGPEFLRTLGLPILEGRDFTDADREGAPRVAIVTAEVARLLWPNEHAVGKRFHDPEQNAPDSLVTVVGVTRDFHFRQYREATPMVLKPYRQVYAQGYFVVRTRGVRSWSSAIARRVVQDAGGTFVDTQSMDDVIAPQLAAPRFDAVLLSIFAFTAMVIAAVGLYGIMASAVSQQTRELGVRLALGATPVGLRLMVLGQALAVTGAGALIGLAGALVAARLLTTLLFQISPADPATLGGVLLLLLVVGVCAAYVPARRATKIDPARALRAE